MTEPNSTLSPFRKFGIFSPTTPLTNVYFDPDISEIYEILVYFFGSLSIVANSTLFVCFFKVKVYSIRQMAMFYFWNILMEIISSVLIMFIQPRLYSTDIIYLFVFQGPVRYLNLGTGNMIIYDVYMALLYSRILIYTFGIVYSIVKFKSNICSLSTAIFISSIFAIALFSSVFITFYRCGSYIETVKFEATSLHIDYTDKNGNFRINWLSKENCPITLIYGYVALGLCTLWVPIYILIRKINPIIKEQENTSVFVAKKEKLSEKTQNKIGIILGLIRFFFLVPSIGVYLFYKTPNDNGYLPLLVDTIIYLFPILLCVIYPCFIMVYAKPYRTYLLSYMPNCLKKSKKTNNTVFIADFLYK